MWNIYEFKFLPLKPAHRVVDTALCALFSFLCEVAVWYPILYFTSENVSVADEKLDKLENLYGN